MNNRNVRLSLLIIQTSVGLLSGHAAGDSTGQSRGEGSSPVPFECRYEKTHPLPASRTIRITSENADVSVSGSDRHDILIQAHYHITSTREMMMGFDYKLSVIEEGGEFRVAESRRIGTRNFIYDKQVHAIKIEVPRKANVTIQEEDGSCVISGIDGGIQLTLDDGKVDLKGCGGDIGLIMDNGTFAMVNCSGSVKYQAR